MFKVYQQTISNPVSIEGIGLHTGKKSKITLLPAKENQGIIFKRVDLKKNNLIFADYKNVSDTQLCTSIKNNHDIKVTTSISHEDGKKDYSSEVAALASAGGDAVAIIGYPEQGGKGIIQASLDSGAFDRFILSEEMINQSLLDTFGEDLDKSFGIVSGYTDRSGLVFEKMLNEIGIDSSTPFTGESYDSAALIVLAIQAGKSFERETIARNIMNIANSPGKKIYPGELKKGLDLLARGKKINYEGVTELEFFKNGEPYGSFFEKKIKNGKFITKKLR